MQNQLELGKLHPGLSYEQYDAEPGLRSSHLHAMRRSPAHFRATMAKPKKVSPQMEFGRLFHLAVEKPAWFREHVVVEPEFEGVTKDGKPTKSRAASDVANQYKEWHAVQKEQGKIILDPDQQENMIGMLTALESHRLVRSMLKETVKETSGWVKDPDTGLILKFRPDIIVNDGQYVVDFKTTRDAHPSYFLGQIFRGRMPSDLFYALNAAHYAHCAKLMKIGSGRNFTIIAVEQTAPWGVMVYPLDEGCLDVGERFRKVLTEQYAECLAKDKWPCYDENAFPVVVPQWAPYPNQELDQLL